MENPTHIFLVRVLFSVSSANKLTKEYNRVQNEDHSHKGEKEVDLKQSLGKSLTFGKGHFGLFHVSYDMIDRNFANSVLFLLTKF